MSLIHPVKLSVLHSIFVVCTLACNWQSGQNYICLIELTPCPKTPCPYKLFPAFLGLYTAWTANVRQTRGDLRCGTMQPLTEMQQPCQILRYLLLLPGRHVSKCINTITLHGFEHTGVLMECLLRFNATDKLIFSIKFKVRTFQIENAQLINICMCDALYWPLKHLLNLSSWVNNEAK